LKSKTYLIVCFSVVSMTLVACGVTVELPSVSLRIPGGVDQLPIPALKLPDIKTQALMAKIDEARRSGGVNALRAESAALKTMFASSAANDFLASVDSLAKVESRRIYFNETEKKWIGAREYDALPRASRSAYKSSEHGEDSYYVGHYQSPLAYARALDVASLHGIASLNGLRVLDMSYGAIGAPRLMAASGANVVATDTQDSLSALYSEPADTGMVSGIGSRRGTLSLVNGAHPSDTSMREKVGSGYDLIIVVDIPRRAAAESKRAKVALDSKASSLDHLRAFADSLKPNGLLVVYRMNDDSIRGTKRIATGKKPMFSAEEMQEAGFKTLAFEQNDDAAVRQMAQLLRWDQTLASEREFTATYTVARR
jgi:hypothetical protein